MSGAECNVTPNLRGHGGTGIFNFLYRKMIHCSRHEVKLNEGSFENLTGKMEVTSSGQNDM